MDELKDYCDGIMKNKLAEENLVLGKAITYLQKHWEVLNNFLRIKGALLNNNALE